MKFKTYKQHLKKWIHAKELVRKHNEELIDTWRSISWYRFWKKPSFEKQRQIIMDNWKKFGYLPAPRMMDYFEMKF